MEVRRTAVTGYSLLGLFVLVALAMLVTCVHGKDILRVSDGSRMDFPDILSDLRGVRLVFVGELHDSAEHHRMQLEVIEQLHNLDVPIAIGLEMFQYGYQSHLDRWVSGAMSPAEFVETYLENWTIPWPYYRDIFLFARDHKIPLIGLNVPPEIISQVARGGFASLSPEQMKKIPGASCNVNEAYEDFIRRSLGMHDQTGKSFTRFCEAQMVWDTTMAQNLLDYLDKNPAVTVVVLAGGGHAWKYGIPEQVRRRSNHSFRVILPELPGKLDRGSATSAETDYLWLD